MRVIRAVIGAILISFTIVIAQVDRASAGETSQGPTSVGSGQSNPYIVFDKSENNNSTLRAFASYGADRYRLVMRAGSGTTKNECESDKGWLPDGYYYPSYRVKTDGLPEVRGAVWYLGDKKCNGGTGVNRWGLFIHSNGIEGTPWDNNWRTEGCIKVAQGDRADLKNFLRSAYNRDSETVHVIP